MRENGVNDIGRSATQADAPRALLKLLHAEPSQLQGQFRVSESVHHA